MAYRRDTPAELPQVRVLRCALTSGDAVATTGMILLELLRGFVPAAAQETIRTAFDALEFIDPPGTAVSRPPAVANACRRAGVQIGSVDPLVAQLAIAGDHTLLTTDNDVHLAARHTELRLWGAPG